MGVNFGGISLSPVDDVTINNNADSEIQVKPTVMSAIQENTIGVIIATSAGEYNPTQQSADLFSQAQGKDSTVNVNLSSAVFDTNLYKADNTTAVTNAHGVTLDNGVYAGVYTGIRFTVTEAGTLTTVTKKSDDGADKCKLVYHGGASIEEVSFVGDVATFTPLAVAVNDDIEIQCRKSSSYFTYQKSTDVSSILPIALPCITVTEGVLNVGNNPAELKSVISLTIIPTTPQRTVQTTNLTAIDGNWDNVRIQVYDYTDATKITYDLSLDGGATWGFTNNAVNEYVIFTSSQTFNNAQVKFKIDCTSEINSFKAYNVMVD